MNRLKYLLMDYDVRRKIKSAAVVIFILVVGMWLSLTVIKDNENRIYRNKDKEYITP